VHQRIWPKVARKRKQPSSAFVGAGDGDVSEQGFESFAQSLEPEIEEHFGFELWLAIGLFLFVAAMAIADWLF
jgi:hypothetical protein